MITADDRVSSVLARDERLLEVLASAAPPLRNLENPQMRRTMASLVTVAQAAQMAGLDPAVLVARLNDALTQAAPSSAPADVAAPAFTPTAVPPELLAIPAERFVDLDVRDDLRNGVEPFKRIMGAVKILKNDQIFRLRATFEPAPLFMVLGKQGFAHFSEQLAGDDWRVWFYREVAGPSSATSALSPAPSTPADDDLVIIDVRGLEPPEPMILTFEALESLPVGKTLCQINVRVPQFLLPKLDERGFTYEVFEQSPELVRVLIRHKPS